MSEDWYRKCTNRHFIHLINGTIAPGNAMEEQARHEEAMLRHILSASFAGKDGATITWVNDAGRTIDFKAHLPERPITLTITADRPAQPPRPPQMPGTALAHWLQMLLSPKAYKMYVYPVIADAQHEYQEAATAGRQWHARWIWLRMYLCVVPGWVYAFGARLLASWLEGKLG